ncbi:MAG TPA: hypothetical protein VGL69_12815 [Solirubrobacteraceae bacterium]
MAMPLGHGREQQRLRPLQRREKLLARGVGGVTVLALVAVLILSLTHSDKRSGHGCIAVSLAYSMGGTQTDACGARARTLCSEVGGPGLSGAAGRDVARACRRAGLPVG